MKPGRPTSTDAAMAIVQARMSSTRRPGKVLADVAGEPILALLARRLGAATGVGRIVIATSDGDDDAPVAALASELGLIAHRGPLEDVLGRFVGALGDHSGPVVRVTGDCPLIDPDVVDAVIASLRDSGADYASNLHPRGFPHGLDCEALTAAQLRRLDSEVRDPDLREHVTLALRENPAGRRMVNVDGDPAVAEFRWTVDTEDDLEFVRALATRLGDRRHHAGWREILEAVRTSPSLAGFRGRRG